MPTSGGALDDTCKVTGRMAARKLSDADAKAILLTWPGSTDTLWRTQNGVGRWIRGQPVTGRIAGPRLASPGATLFTTQPDGLYVYYQGVEWCDLVAIEVCGTVQNLNDKRSRYIPASHSLLLRTSSAWLNERASIGRGNVERYSTAGTFNAAPAADLASPVRFLRVLYALPNDLYGNWVSHNAPGAYEYFCPHSSLDSYNAPKMQSFLKRMAVASQFYLTR